MKAYFLATDGAAASDRDAITAFLVGRGFNVWHWFQELWFIADVPDDDDLAHLRHTMRQVVPALHQVPHLLMDFRTRGGMAGALPASAWKWIQANPFLGFPETPDEMDDPRSPTASVTPPSSV